MGVREKKITVKFFLNTDVKGRRLELGGNVMYPLYTRVTYNRRSTKFAIGNNWFSKEQESSLKDVKEFKEVRKVITKIVEFEASREGDNYRVAGLGLRMKTYVSHLYKGLTELLIEALKIELEKHLTVVKFKTWTSLDLFDKIEKGIKELGSQISPNLNQLVLATSIVGGFKDVNPILIYAWLTGESRNYTITRINEGISRLVEEGTEYKAFNITYSLNGLMDKKEFDSFIKFIDEACLELIDKEFSEYLDIKNISFSP